MSLLRVREIGLQFGFRWVLQDVSLDVPDQGIVAVIGPNGAGKTALLNCISGIYEPQRGSVQLAGEELLERRPDQVAARGIGRSFQHLELFGRLTVVENLQVARYAQTRSGVLRCAMFWGPAQREEIQHRQRVEEILDFFELDPYRNKLARGLPFGIQKLVGVARAMATDPTVLLLDEPGSGLTRDEKEDLARFLLRIRYERRIPILWVEHDIQMVLDLADSVHVLDFGRTLAHGAPKQVRQDPAVIDAYLGAVVDRMEETRDGPIDRSGTREGEEAMRWTT